MRGMSHLFLMTVVVPRPSAGGKTYLFIEIHVIEYFSYLLLQTELVNQG